MRARIVLLAAAGHSNRDIARRLGINPITVARWRSRFLVLGIDGIRDEAPRLGSPPRVPQEQVQAVLTKTRFERPVGAVRWSTRSLARVVGVSHSTVRRIWEAHNVRPPRSRIATIPRDVRFRARSVDVVGVYVNPPQRTVAISLHDPAEPQPRGRAERAPTPVRRPAPQRRPWMADLVTTLDLLDRGELKGSSRRLVDSEFLSFLHSVQKRRRGGEQIQILSQSSGTSLPPPLTRWLERHPEFSADVKVGTDPLPQLVAEWFGESSGRPLTEVPPASLPGLRTAVERWARESSVEPRPFAWTRK